MPLAWVSSSLVTWLHAVWREHHSLWPGLPHLCHRMAVRRMAQVLLPLASAISSFLSYGCTPYGASIIAFGLGYLIFTVVWLYVVCREYYCLWPRLTHLRYHMAIRHMARVLLPLAWVTSCLPLYGGTSYGASIIAFGLA